MTTKEKLDEPDKIVFFISDRFVYWFRNGSDETVSLRGMNFCCSNKDMAPSSCIVYTRVCTVHKVHTNAHLLWCSQCQMNIELVALFLTLYKMFAQ